jgi:hypothetical protein
MLQGTYPSHNKLNACTLSQALSNNENEGCIVVVVVVVVVVVCVFTFSLKQLL